MRAILSLLFAGLMSATTFGAYVVFEPGGEATLPSGASSVAIDVTVVGETLSVMQGIDLVLYPPNLPFTWSYSDAAGEAFHRLTRPSPWNNNMGLVVGGLRLVEPVPADLLLGTLTVDTSGLGHGDAFSVVVDPVRDTGVSAVLNGAQSDPIGFAEVRFQVVPEPTTIVVLVLGATALLARRSVRAKIRFQ